MLNRVVIWLLILLVFLLSFCSFTYYKTDDFLNLIKEDIVGFVSNNFSQIDSLDYDIISGNYNDHFTIENLQLSILNKYTLDLDLIIEIKFLDFLIYLIDNFKLSKKNAIYTLYKKNIYKISDFRLNDSELSVNSRIFNIVFSPLDSNCEI